MVANIALGSGHNGAVGSVGIMTMIGAGIAGSSIARGIATGGAGAAAVAGATGSMTVEKLMERIGVLEDLNAAGGGDIGMVGSGELWRGK